MYVAERSRVKLHTQLSSGLALQQLNCLMGVVSRRVISIC